MSIMDQWQLRRTLRGYEFWKCPNMRRGILREARRQGNAKEIVTAAKGLQKNYDDWAQRRLNELG